MNLIDEIKSKVNILQLAIECGLEPTRNNFIFSIYKNEKNRSLKLYPETNSFYCFSTGNWGDVIDFYADYKRLDLKTAIKELAEGAGIDMSGGCHIYATERKEKRKFKVKEVKIFGKEKEFYDELAGIFEYSQGLSKMCAESEALNEVLKRRKEQQKLIYESLEKFCFGVDEETLDYLLGPSRGLKPESIKRFRLFSIKNSKKTVQYLYDCFAPDDIILSGLLNKTGKFIFQYHKLIIPYMENGEIVYIRGRKLKVKDKDFKYISLNNMTGSLPLKRFYNIDTLKSLKEGDPLFICEGEFDAMMIEQAGGNALGIPGVTNIPEKEIKKLKDYNLYFAFDNDAAGKSAENRISWVLKKPIKTIMLNEYKDVTELLNGSES